MFINDWARAYRWHLAATPEMTLLDDPSYSSISFPVMDKSVLIPGSKGRRQEWGPPTGGNQGKSGRGEFKLDQRAGSAAAGTVVLELSASSAAISHQMPLTPSANSTKESSIITEVKPQTAVPHGSESGLEPQLPACLALQQLPSGGWTPTLGRMRQVGIKPTCNRIILPHFHTYMNSTLSHLYPG